MQITDTDLRTFMRSHLARHRIDMGKLQLRVFNGTVRMSGEILHLGEHKQVTMSTVENLEREILATTGVHHAFLEFDNFRRTGDGIWEEVQEVEAVVEEEEPGFVAAIPIEELLSVRPTRRAAA